MTDLTKGEILAMAHEADDTIRSKPFTAEMLSFLERFAALCRAPLVAEIEALREQLKALGVYNESTKAELARAVEPVLWQYRWTNPSGDPHQESQTDWKQVEPTWNQTVQQKCDELLAYRFGGKPTYEVRGLYATPPQPAAQEPDCAVHVVEQLVEALDGLFSGDVVVWSLGGSARPRAAIAAGQQYLKENGK